MEMTPTNSTLCSCCLEIFTKKHEPAKVHVRERLLFSDRHHESGTALIEAAERSCPLCRRILDLSTQYYKSSGHLGRFREYEIFWEICRSREGSETELAFLAWIIGGAENDGDSIELATFNITPLSGRFLYCL